MTILKIYFFFFNFKDNYKNYFDYLFYYLINFFGLKNDKVNNNFNENIDINNDKSKYNNNINKNLICYNCKKYIMKDMYLINDKYFCSSKCRYKFHNLIN